jgi:hypothetical protein
LLLNGPIQVADSRAQWSRSRGQRRRLPWRDLRVVLNAQYGIPIARYVLWDGSRGGNWLTTRRWRTRNPDHDNLAIFPFASVVILRRCKASPRI